MDQITLQTLSFYEYSPKDFHIEDHPLLNHNPDYLTHSLRRITHAAKVVVTVSLIVEHPSPQSVQKFGYAVTVGVVGHAVFGAGKVIVLVTTSTHAGRAGQEVSDGHKLVDAIVMYVKQEVDPCVWSSWGAAKPALLMIIAAMII